MPISRDRIQKRSGNPTGNRAPVNPKPSPGRSLVMDGVLADHPWVTSAAVLMRIFSAPTPEEFDKHATKFNRAFGEFRDHLMKLRLNPEEYGGQRFRDPNVEGALQQLNSAMLSAKYGDPLSDPEGVTRRGEIGNKFQHLMIKLTWIPK